MAVLLSVLAERHRQDKKWGQQDHNIHRWSTILGEEFGESCKEAFEGNLHSYRAELIRVAAVAVAAIECLDRKIALDFSKG